MLYEVDGHDDHQLAIALDVFRRSGTSYICYQSKNGFHFVGFTPLRSAQWGYWFDKLQMVAPEYYSGQTLRVSLKEGETQRLIESDFKHPYVFRLARMYARRFGIEKELPIYGEMPIYSSVFERYWTGKID